MARNLGRSKLPESVRDSTLETRVDKDSFVHLYYDRPGRRVAPREERWKTKAKLGSGSFGTVFLLESIVDHESPRQQQYRAVKEISSRAKKPLDFYKNELVAFAKFSNRKYARCFVQSFGWFETFESLYISMEFCAFGDLQSYLAGHHELPEIEVQEIIAQVTQGLDFMHEEGFSHRDLKPQNILIKSHPPDDEWWIKICDFGLTKRMEEATGETMFGSYGFLAPELIHDREMAKCYRYAADIWCLGETAFHLLSNRSLFSHDYHELQDYYVGKVAFPAHKFAELGTSLAAINFISTAMAAKPSERSTARQCLKHGWISAMGDDIDDNGSREEPPSSPMDVPGGPLYDDWSTQPSGVWSTPVSSVRSTDGREGIRSHPWSLGSTLREETGLEGHEAAPSHQREPGEIWARHEYENTHGLNRSTTRHDKGRQTVSQQLQTGASSRLIRPTAHMDDHPGQELRHDEEVHEPQDRDWRIGTSASLQNSSQALEALDQMSNRRDELGLEVSRLSSGHDVTITTSPTSQQCLGSSEKLIEPRPPDDEPGESALQRFASKKRINFIQKFSIRSQGSKNRTDLLCEAAEKGDLSTARTLIKAGAAINGAGKKGYTPLGMATREDHYDLASMLLEHGADVRMGWKAKSSKETASSVISDNGTAAEFNACSTPLHLAAQFGSVELVNLLISSYGARVNASSVAHHDYLRTGPLGLARDDEIAAALLKHGAYVNGDPGEQKDVAPLILAVKDRRVSCARVLLQHKAIVDCRDRNNCTPLFYACEGTGGKVALELVEMLLTSGASVAVRSIGFTRIGSRPWCPLSKLCTRMSLDQYDVMCASRFVAAFNQPSKPELRELDFSLWSLCRLFSFEDVDIRRELMNLLLGAGASPNFLVSEVNALHKLFGRFIFRAKNYPNEEESIQLMLKCSTTLIKADASLEKLIRDLQHDQTRIQHCRSPAQYHYALKMFTFALDEAEECADAGLVKNRLELCWTFLRWSQKIKSLHGLDRLEENLDEFWDILDKMGLSGKAQQPDEDLEKFWDVIDRLSPSAETRQPKLTSPLSSSNLFAAHLTV